MSFFVRGNASYYSVDFKTMDHLGLAVTKSRTKHLAEFQAVVKQGQFVSKFVGFCIVLTAEGTFQNGGGG